MNSWDKKLILGGFLAGILLLCMAGIFGTQKKGHTAEVTKEGEILLTIDLHQEGIYPIPGTGNVLEVEKGTIRMIEADCPRKLCLKMKPISALGETILCLPHRIVVTVTEGEKGDYDAVSR